MDARTPARENSCRAREPARGHHGHTSPPLRAILDHGNADATGLDTLHAAAAGEARGRGRYVSTGASQGAASRAARLESAPEEPPSTASHAPERLRAAIEHGAHYLPTQGPLELFIHHNTLHAFESLPFHRAITTAAKLVGGRGYLSEARFREAYAAGRIDDRDLELAIAYRRALPDAAARSPHALASPAAVLRAAMLHDLDVEPAARVRWRLREDFALTEPGDELRWSVCLDAVRRIGRSRRPDLRADAAAVLDRLGELSHRDLVRMFADIDVSEYVDRWLIRACAAHLDEGLAADRDDDRRLGLYAHWRRFQRPGRRYLRGLPAALRLPEDPLDAVAVSLAGLGVGADRVDAYITRVLQHLPGWGGLIHWREHNRDHRPQLPPVALVDYLAMRLLGEWSELERVCRDTWGCAIAALVEHLRQRPDEAAVRLALHEGHVSDVLARKSRRAMDRGGATSEATCAALVEEIEHDTEGADLERAWQLHRLTRALHLYGTELQATPIERIAELSSLLDGFAAAVRLPIWQEAYEIHYRDQVLEALHDGREHRHVATGRGQLQVVTCIDDREEGIRRHIEETEPRAETFGTGGFFGIPISFRGRNDEEFSALCPLGVTPAHRVLEVPCDDEHRGARRYDSSRAAVRRWRGHWRSILGHGWASLLGAYAVGFFAWLWLLGQLVFPRRFDRARRLVTRALMPEHPTVLTTDESCREPQHAIAGFTLREQVERVGATLTNIGLVRNFARVIAIVAHGSTSTNNPHYAAYDCGACGGRHGGPNARLFTLMANSPAVRAGLRGNGIDIPDDAHFVGGEHNTTNEGFTWWDLDRLPDSHRDDFRHLEQVVAEAARRSAQERCRKFDHAPRHGGPEDVLRHVQERALDPSQARPELNHATNALAVFGRRRLTRGAFLDRRAFLVSYDPESDAGGEVLERLLMALVPVIAGINLEYYFSTCDPQVYGAGTKLPHNVVGLVGVMDGGSSDLRTGLPTQMTEVHEPVRVLLVLEQTPAVIAAIMARQPAIRRLFENGWVLVACIGPEDGATRVWVPDDGFVSWQPRGLTLPVVHNSAAWFTGHDELLSPARIVAPRRIAGAT